MLNERRIKEAESNVKTYILDGLLRKTEDKTMLNVFLKNAKDSIKASKLMIDNDIFLWSIVCAYYSMFYMANAVLMNLNYKTGDKIVHKVTADALIVIVRGKLNDNLLEDFEETQEEALKISKTDEIIASFDFERRKRNFIQYQTSLEDVKTKAETSFKRASEFLFEMESLLDN